MSELRWLRKAGKRSPRLAMHFARPEQSAFGRSQVIGETERKISAGIWVGGQLGEDESKRLAQFLLALGRGECAAAALLDFPRRAIASKSRIRRELLRALGKPWLNVDLVMTLKYAVEHSNVENRFPLRSPHSYHSAIALRRISLFQSASWMGQASILSRPVIDGSSLADAASPESCACRQTLSSSGNNRGVRPPAFVRRQRNLPRSHNVTTIGGDISSMRRAINSWLAVV